MLAGRGTPPTTTLILAGVAVGSFASALTSFFMLRSEGEVRRALAWLLGGFDDRLGPGLCFCLIYCSVSVLLTSGHALNVLQFGDEQALQLGLPVERIKHHRPGRLVDHSYRRRLLRRDRFYWVDRPSPGAPALGPDYRHLIPLSILGGATALLIADLLARIVLAPQELPVGVITALAGAPFFLWVLRRSRGGKMDE
jgi:iron complex transport system permease protein